ncbi:MAG: cobalamin biosynthesis protein CobW [Azospirillaceae bacterium]
MSPDTATPATPEAPAARRLAKVPATVVTGFLGAGKTTLIRHLLTNAGGRRIALVVNEFGDVGVDGDLLRACGSEACGDDDIVELANGCLCCTVADDFLPTITKLLDRPEPPDHIVIETSGLALPKPLVKAFAWPDVRTRVTVDGVVAVIDAPAVAAGLFAADPAAVDATREVDRSLDHDSPLEELFEDQVRCADLVILNKTDLVDADTLAKAEATVGAELREGVHVVHAAHGAVPPGVLLGLGAEAEGDLDTRPSHHDADPDHDHDDFESFIVDLPPVAEPADLAARIEAALSGFPILRLKGFAAVEGKAMRLVVQAVGRRLQHYYDRDWQAGETRATRLVVIGETGLDRDGIAAALAGPAA